MPEVISHLERNMTEGVSLSNGLTYQLRLLLSIPWCAKETLNNCEQLHPFG